jgi:hypothetical protein
VVTLTLSTQLQGQQAAVCHHRNQTCKKTKTIMTGYL